MAQSPTVYQFDPRFVLDAAVIAGSDAASGDKVNTQVLGEGLTFPEDDRREIETTTVSSTEESFLPTIKTGQTIQFQFFADPGASGLFTQLETLESSQSKVNFSWQMIDPGLTGSPPALNPPTAGNPRWTKPVRVKKFSKWQVEGPLSAWKCSVELRGAGDTTKETS